MSHTRNHNNSTDKTDIIQKLQQFLLNHQIYNQHLTEGKDTQKAAKALRCSAKALMSPKIQLAIKRLFNDAERWAKNNHFGKNLFGLTKDEYFAYIDYTINKEIYLSYDQYIAYKTLDQWFMGEKNLQKLKEYWEKLDGKFPDQSFEWFIEQLKGICEEFIISVPGIQQQCLLKHIKSKIEDVKKLIEIFNKSVSDDDLRYGQNGLSSFNLSDFEEVKSKIINKVRAKYKEIYEYKKQRGWTQEEQWTEEQKEHISNIITRIFEYNDLFFGYQEIKLLHYHVLLDTLKVAYDIIKRTNRRTIESNNTEQIVLTLGNFLLRIKLNPTKNNLIKLLDILWNILRIEESKHITTDTTSPKAVYTYSKLPGQKPSWGKYNKNKQTSKTN